VKKINILHIITHDTGRYLGCYGENIKTPEIDKLAENGIVFTNYFCTAPQCSPSRASMFSSLMPHQNGVYGFAHRGFILREDINYLPKILQRNGYRTFLFGIQHETSWEKAETLGYEKAFKGKSFSCDDITPLLIEFLKQNPSEPFFISCGFIETHRPFPVVENVSENLKIPSFLPDEIEVKKDIAGLNVLVEKVDKSVGEIVKTLEETGLAKNTLIIFTTDHGIAFPGAKATLFDPGIGISLIMRGPDIPSGERIDCLSSNLDFMPTILDYLEIDIPENIEGKSLMPAIKKERKEVRDKIFTELTYHAAYDPMRSVRTKKYKYIRNFEARPYYFPPNVDPGFSKELFRRSEYYEKIRPFEFFFDLEKDPFEKENLIDNPEYKNTIDEFRKILLKWMKETDDPLLKGMVIPPEGAKITPPWAYQPEVIWMEKEIK